MFRADAVHIIVVPDEKTSKMALSYKEMAARTRANIFVVKSMDEARELLRSMGHQL